MTDPLWLDPGEMHASAAELDAVAEEVAQMVAELKAALAHDGECWGNDKPGKTFAESYVPSSEQGMAGLENLVDGVRAIGAGIRATTAALAEVDTAGATQVSSFDPTGMMSADSSAQAYRSPESTWRYPERIDQPVQQPTGSTRLRGDSTANAGGTRPSGSAQQTTTDRSPSVQQQQPAPEPAQRQPFEPDRPDTADPSAPDRGAGADPSRDAQPATFPAPSISTPVLTTPRGAEASASTASADPKQPAGRTDSARTGPASPWGRNAGGPFRPLGAGSSVPQDNSAPPQASPPRTTDRPPARAKPVEDPRRTPPREREAVRARRESSDEAMAILREMAARHDLEIAGFETAGIAEPTAHEIAEAVDTVLAGHPIILCGIQVAEDGPPSLVENRSEAAAIPAAGTSPPPEPWIVLSGAAAADPGVIIERDRVRPGSVHPLLRQRPMYVTMLLELGRVLDLTGGSRARGEAQRTLIAEYLRISGAGDESLGRIVTGYKSWRAELGDYCFDNGMFSPGRALAAAFAAVELHGPDAPASAKALHRLLVSMAQAAQPGK
ncbi:hypothetical protein AB0H42_01950 [Nocardia sp. NPDC050799]|uniref:WXG100 family type VII secretion target n=1 Tax=Nocardia sp. NPDC050799 TaxID=3154842 RepID=UPI0033DA3E0C